MSDEATKKKFKFIIGSEGNPDFLVVAQNGPHVIGVKPLILPLATNDGFKGMYVAVRLRATWAGQKNDVVEVESTNVFHLGSKAKQTQSIAEAFPGVKFMKIDETRASTVLGFVIKRAPFQTKEIVEAIEKTNFVGKVAEFLGNAIPVSQMIIEPDDFATWVKGKYAEMFEEMDKFLSGLTAPVDPEIKLEYEPEVFAKLMAPPTAADKAASKGIKLISSNDLPDPETRH